jgi:hypothetical protein
MNYEKIERAHWKDFFDAVSKGLEGKLVELEVAGLDLGDQVEGARLNLNGITYDPHDEALYLSIQTGMGTHVDHAILSPVEIYVEIGELGFSSVAVIEPDGRKQFVHLSDPLKLPAAAAAY